MASKKVLIGATETALVLNVTVNAVWYKARTGALPVAARDPLRFDLAVVHEHRNWMARRPVRMGRPLKTAKKKTAKGLLREIVR